MDLLRNLAVPVIRRRRSDGDKPPMPELLGPALEQAEKRNGKRYAGPGAAVEVEKLTATDYRVVSPHADHAAWMVMIADALGTRSASTTTAFLNMLSQLCQQHRVPNGETDEFGNDVHEYVPDETELNMLLQMVGGIRPRNEMEAALAATAVSTFLMHMRASAQALQGLRLDERTAATASRLARTFGGLMDTLHRMRGKGRSTKQRITVKHEKHIHHHQHQHVHLEGGSADFGGQPHEPMEGRPSGDGSSSALPSSDAGGSVVPLARRQGQAGLSATRRQITRRAQG